MRQGTDLVTGDEGALVLRKAGLLAGGAREPQAYAASAASRPNPNRYHCSIHAACNLM